MIIHFNNLFFNSKKKKNINIIYKQKYVLIFSEYTNKLKYRWILIAIIYNLKINIKIDNYQIKLLSEFIKYYTIIVV
jgi:hypothetical protein